MKIALLTSSRADYGIYMPLLNELKKEDSFQVEIVAFGTHLSKYHGFTLYEIEESTDYKIHTLSAIISNDDEESIASSYGLTVLKFAQFWNEHKYDVVFCIGDRFEMSAAVQAGIPFGVFFAHIGGGEKTLGAIDETYRHQITLASSLHFSATELYGEKVKSLVEDEESVYVVGSLSMGGITDFTPTPKEEFYEKYKIPNRDFALVTFHPETVEAHNNVAFANEMEKGLSEILDSINLIVTMPNADTQGSVYREKLIQIEKAHPNKIILIENFGRQNYFTAMHYSKFLIGNTSSGIVEAASFGKYVVNVGDRQKGRAQSENILNAKFTQENMVSQTKKAMSLGDYTGENVYHKTGTVSTMIKVLKAL